jgi:biotin operon repressor
LKKLTQKEEVLKHLKTVGEISSLLAIKKYNNTRLAAHIHTLRKEGYKISDRRGYGNGKNWKIYYIAKTESDNLTSDLVRDFVERGEQHD